MVGFLRSSQRSYVPQLQPSVLRGEVMVGREVGTFHDAPHLEITAPARPVSPTPHSRAVEGVNPKIEWGGVPPRSMDDGESACCATPPLLVLCKHYFIPSGTTLVLYYRTGALATVRAVNLHLHQLRCVPAAAIF